MNALNWVAAEINCIRFSPMAHRKAVRELRGKDTAEGSGGKPKINVAGQSDSRTGQPAEA